MGKVTGFKEYDRELPNKIAPIERLENYNEFVQEYEPEKLNQQAARCMNCGSPFCHSGCPLGNVIPEFNDAVYQGKWEDAYLILASTNNFPEFTGRICPAPCEAACVLGINKPAVAIEEIEKHIIEIAFSKGFVKPNTPISRSGKNVAIIGSGPAGLAAAAQMNKAGHTVVVYERDDRPGGLLRYGIPDFKLEKSVIDRRLDVMEQEGITFICNTEIGVKEDMKAFIDKHDAVIMAAGSTIPRNLTIPGRDFKGIHFAMDFLTQQNKNVSNSAIPGERILATGKDVVVIGGGDTGSDCVGTSNRQHANSVKQFELMVQPPAQRNENMPWPTYPMILKTSSSHEEGCERFWGINTKEFLGNDNGELRVEGSEREIPCQLILLAMGFLHPQHQGLVQNSGLELDSRGNVNAVEGKYQTNIQKVFAAGDMRRGQSLVVWAISEGREAARKADEFLMGRTSLPSKDRIIEYVNL